jgi:hypothetical protein
VAVYGIQYLHVKSIDVSQFSKHSSPFLNIQVSFLHHSQQYTQPSCLTVSFSPASFLRQGNSNTTSSYTHLPFINRVISQARQLKYHWQPHLPPLYQLPNTYWQPQHTNKQPALLVKQVRYPIRLQLHMNQCYSWPKTPTCNLQQAPPAITSTAGETIQDHSNTAYSHTPNFSSTSNQDDTGHQCSLLYSRGF